jgi:hypothetical protein
LRSIHEQRALNSARASQRFGLKAPPATCVE